MTSYRDKEEMEKLRKPKDSPTRINQREGYIENFDIDTRRRPSEHRSKGVDRSPVSQGREEPKAHIESKIESDSDNYYKSVRKTKIFRSKKKKTIKESISVKIEF